MALKAGSLWNSSMARWSEVGARRRNRRTSITALDVEGDHLHVVQAAVRGGQARVVRQVVAALERPAGTEADDPVALGRALATALRRAGLSPGTVVMGVPRAQVMLRTLDLPPADRVEEIAAMAHLRLSRDLPFRLDEALIDFKTLDRRPSTVSSGAASPEAASPETASAPPPALPTRVLTAVVRRTTVEFYQSVAAAAGLKLAALGLRSLAGAHAALRQHPEAANDCVALVFLERHEVVFDVLVQGTLVFSRIEALPTAPQPRSESGRPTTDPARNPWLLEVVRGLHSYEGTEGHRPVNRFLVMGDTGGETALAEALAQHLSVPARVLEPAAEWSATQPASGFSPRALPAIGLALGALEAPGLPFDFLHPKRPPVARDNRRLRLLALAAGGLAVLLTAAGLRAHWINQRERLRAELQEQVALGAKNLAAYRLVRNQARALRDWSVGSRNWLDHLALLSALLPPSRELYVTALSTSARNTLSLSVKVRGGETVDRLTATLRSAGYEVKAPAIMPSTDRFGFRFQANLELEVPATITNDLDRLIVESRPSGPPSTPASAPLPASAPPAADTPPSPAPAPAPAFEPGRSDSDAQNRTPRFRRRRPEGGGRE